MTGESPLDRYIARLRATFPVLRGLPDTLDEVERGLRGRDSAISDAVTDQTLRILQRSISGPIRYPAVGEMVGVMLMVIREVEAEAPGPPVRDVHGPRRVQGRTCHQIGCTGAVIYYPDAAVLRCEDCLRVQTARGGIYLDRDEIDALSLEPMALYSEAEIREAMDRYRRPPEAAPAAGEEMDERRES